MKNTQKRDTILIIAVLFGIIAILYVLTLKGSHRRQMERTIQIQTENVNIITPEPELVEEEVEILPTEASALAQPTDMITATTDEMVPALEIETSALDATPVPTSSPLPVSEGITQVNLASE